MNPCQQKDDLLVDRQDIQRTRDSRRGVERKGTHSSPVSTEITSSILYLSACEFRSSLFGSEQIFTVDELVCSLVALETFTCPLSEHANLKQGNKFVM